ISKICRKVVKTTLETNPGANRRAKRGAAQGDIATVRITSENLADFLGVRRFNYGMAEKENKIGQVTGLAWTEVGGDLLTIEVADMPGKGNVIRTGSLGDVMKESVETARTVVRARAQKWGILSSVFE